MIDWQVKVDGNYPSGWDEHRDGCWFPSFEYQEYLLPYFDVGGETIDAYGGTAYAHDDLRRLHKRLLNWRYFFEVRPTQWQIVDSVALYDKEFIVEREVVLEIFDTTLTMIDIALRKGGVLWFRGD